MLQLTLNSPYGINNFTWAEALARFYSPVIMSPDKAWIMYYGRTNEHAVVHRVTGDVHTAFGYHIWTLFNRLSDVEISVIKAAIELHESGINDYSYWRDKWVKAIWIGVENSFLNAEGVTYSYKSGDIICGYIDNDNRLSFINKSGVYLNQVAQIEEIGKEVAVEFNRKSGYDWNNSLGYFDSLYLAHKRGMPIVKQPKPITPDVDKYKILETSGYQMFNDIIGMGVSTGGYIRTYYLKSGEIVCDLCEDHDGEREDMQRAADIVRAKCIEVAWEHMQAKQKELSMAIFDKDDVVSKEQVLNRVVINGVAILVYLDELTYDDIIRLAYGNDAVEKQTPFIITYDNGNIILPSQTVKVQDGMVFDVIVNNNT